MTESLLNLDDDAGDDAGDDGVQTLDAARPPSSPDGPATVVIELECDLTDAEVQNRGEDMAAEERACERLKLRRKALNADIRGKLDRMTALAIAIDSRKEVRDVQCTWHPDYERKQWDLKRDDTGRVIRTRVMSALDLQTRLPLESADADDADDEYEADDDGIIRVSADDDPDPAYSDDPIPGFDAPADAPANDNVRLLPARSTPDAVAAMAKHGHGGTAARTPARKRATTPATPKRKKSSKKAR